MKEAEVEVTIREFLPGDETAFRRLNEEWILRYFAMEAKDEEALADPRRTIVDRGGRIFFAVQQGKEVGCCALVTSGPGEYEVAKMAVTESCQGMGVGRRLMERAIAEARASGARRLFLETNKRLAPAIRLYESVGFRHLPPRSDSEYARSDVYMTMELEAVADERGSMPMKN